MTGENGKYPLKNRIIHKYVCYNQDMRDERIRSSARQNDEDRL